MEVKCDLYEDGGQYIKTYRDAGIICHEYRDLPEMHPRVVTAFTNPLALGQAAL